MKRPVRITWKLYSMSRLDVVSCRWEILDWTMAHLAFHKISLVIRCHRPSQGATVCPSRSFRSLCWPWYWQLTARTMIIPSSTPSVSFPTTIALARGLTIAYGILLRASPFRALCWKSATAILHQVSWPSLEPNRRLLFERVGYCESEERGWTTCIWRYSRPTLMADWLTPIASSVVWLHSLPPKSLAIVHQSCYTAPPLIPRTSSERPEGRGNSSQDFCGGGPGAQ